MSKEHPILFSPDMIRAQLQGIKTMTRRMINHTNSLVDGMNVSAKTWAAYYFNFSQAIIDKGPSPAGNPGPYLKVPSKIHPTTHRVYPKYQAGDILFVRESWKISIREDKPVCSTMEYADGIEITHCVPIYEYIKWTDWLKQYVETNKERNILKPGIHLPKWGSRIWHEVIRCYPERIQDITEEDAVKEGMNIIGGQMSARTKFNMLWNDMHPGSWRDNDPVWVTEFKMLSSTGKPESILN